MTRQEYFLAKFEEKRLASGKRFQEFAENSADYFIEPFKISDNIYYVGDKKVCIHLIDTGDGLILIDSGYPWCKHLLVESIRRTGLDPKNIRWLLHTHGHFDHFGASEEFRKLYGCKLAISKVDAESLRQKPHRSHIDTYTCQNNGLRIPEFDLEFEDGEVFELGNTRIRCVLTPGHTVGVMSFFFDTTFNGETHLAGLFGGAGISAILLPHMTYNEDEFDCPNAMLCSLERVENEPVTIHLGNHPSNNDTLAKREKQLKEGGNPFVSADSWTNFIKRMKEAAKTAAIQNEEMEREYELMNSKQM